MLAKIGEAKKTCIAHVIAVVVAVFEARRRRRRRLIGSPRSWAAPVAMRWPSVRFGASQHVGVAQDLPMGALTVTFAMRRYNIPDAVVLSLVTSSIMLGMKLDKLSLLKHWYAIVAWRGWSLV